MATKEANTKKAVAKNKEEEAVLLMYRGLARWNQYAIHMVLDAMCHGQLANDTTDPRSWAEIRKVYEFAPQRPGQGG